MAGFLTPLITEYINGCQWRVFEPFEFCLGAADGPERIIIPVGFITDFASIPRLLWPVLPPTGRYGKAAVIHDWLYQKRIIEIPGLPGFRLCDRAEADHILLEGMQVLTVNWPTRSTVYSGVRVGGWYPWGKYRRAEAK